MLETLFTWLFAQLLEPVKELVSARLKQLVKYTDERLGRSGLRILARVARHEREYLSDLRVKLQHLRTQGLKHGSAYGLDLEGLYVPLSMSPSDPGVIPQSMVAAGPASQSLEIWDYLKPKNESKHELRRIVLLARPGAGKTTLLESLALTFASTPIRAEPRVPRLIPILLYLRDVAKTWNSEEPPELAALVTQTLFEDGASLTAPKDWLGEKLKSDNSRCLVMLDGLDEIADDDTRASVSKWIDEQMKKHSGARFIVTSRPQAYRTDELRQVQLVLELHPFSRAQIREFVHGWVLENETKKRLYDPKHMNSDRALEAFARDEAGRVIRAIAESEVLSDLAVNPLLLTMITMVLLNSQNNVPQSKLEIYKDICDLLLTRGAPRKSATDALNRLQKHRLLQRIAYELMVGNTLAFDVANAERWIGAMLRDLADSRVGAVGAATFIDDTAERSGLLIKRENGEYEFCHKILQEYFAAVQLKEENSEQLVLENFGKSWWDETIRLYAAQVDTGNLVRHALSDRTALKLALANDCVEQGYSTPTPIQEELRAVLDGGFESDDIATRQLVAEVRLSQRLRRLYALDHGVQIDTSLLTCAEYALFARERPVEIPGDWDAETRTPPKGVARKAVTGIDPETARDFCDWLSGTSPSNKRYRLPTRAESEAAPLSDTGAGHWCDDEGNVTLSGFLAADVQAMAQELDMHVDELHALVSSEHGSTLNILSHHELQRAIVDLDIAPPTRWPDCDFSIAWALAIELPDDGRLAGLLAIAALLDDVLERAPDAELGQTLKTVYERTLQRARDAAREVPSRRLASALDFEIRMTTPKRRRDGDRVVGKLLDDLDSELRRAGDVITDYPAIMDGFRRRNPDDFAYVIARELDRHLDSLGPALAFSLELARELESPQLLFQGWRQLISWWSNRRSSWSSPALSALPAQMLCDVLQLTDFYARMQMKELERAALDDGAPDMSASEYEFATEHYRQRAATVASLQAWAKLYAARERANHCGWEGIRIARCPVQTVV